MLRGAGGFHYFKKFVGFLVSWFLGCLFLGFLVSRLLVSWFLGFLVSEFLGFLVSKSLSCKDSEFR